MTRPRRIVPGTSYMLTRRTTQRMFLLRPDNITRDAFIYCFALTAQRHSIDVHWLTVMSNHYHSGICDVTGRVPAFLRDFHGLLARCINAARGRWENLWASEQAGMLELVDADAVFDKMIYGLTNPCAANLVDKVSHWPGVSSFANVLTGKPITARRPHWFFDRENGSLPDTVELRFVRPKEFADLSEQAWRDKVEAAVTSRETELKQQRQEKGVKLVGRKAVRRQSANSQPKTVAKRRTLNPRVAGRNMWKRIEALLRNKRFGALYRAAMKRYRLGERHVVFPFGTYKLRHMGHVRVEPPPLAA